MIIKRDTSIDFIKLIALILVLNSHMGICYPRFSFLATGGGIGDALFFFASGFTLFLGRKMNFVDWYSRRIRRIYPSIFAVAFVAFAVFGAQDSMVDVILARRYWFIQCIMLIYPLLYLIKQYVNRPIYLVPAFTVIALCVYPFFFSGSLVYGGGYFRWGVYFCFMLLGGIVGLYRERFAHFNLWISCGVFFGCVVLWYALLYFIGATAWHIVSIIPLMGVAISLYAIGRSDLAEKIYHSRIVGGVLISLGALCLESYLVQKYIITDQWNSIFPWNIPVIFFLVLVASYLVRILANIISQVFDSNPFEWKKVWRCY